MQAAVLLVVLCVMLFYLSSCASQTKNQAGIPTASMPGTYETTQPAGEGGTVADSSVLPEDLQYSAEHMWLRIQGNSATIGITDYAQRKLSDIVHFDVDFERQPRNIEGQLPPFVGKDWRIGTVETVKASTELRSPISGWIVAVNAELQSNPELINKDPYGKGWMIKIELTDSKETSVLMNASGYRSYVQEH